jgi:hypothetical protein
MDINSPAAAAAAIIAGTAPARTTTTAYLRPVMRMYYHCCCCCHHCRYGTSKNYDYSNPQYMESSFPFTQIVWRSTFAVGCAAQTCSSGIVGTLVLCRCVDAAAA